METDIAPLAKRLADENNVDWRKLEGTGENGRIVERDVLDYLARVMAGEAAVDPTPEPLPEGMDAWVDDDGTPLAPADADAVDEQPTARAAPFDGDEDLLLAGDDLASDEAASTGPDQPDEVPSSVPTSSSGAGVERAAHDAPDLFAADDDDATSSSDSPDLFEMDDGRSEPEPKRDHTSDSFDFGGLPGADRRDHEASDDDEDGISFDLGGDDRTADDATTADAGEGDHAAFDIGDETTSQVSDAVHEVEPADEPVSAPASEPAPEVHDTPEPAAPADLPLARTKMVIRRHVDLGGMLELQRSVGLETGRSQVPATAVLLLAARRAAGRIDVEAPGVAVVGGASNVRVLVPAAATLGDVSDEIDEVQRGASVANDDADLWVVDLSGLGIDEAILDTDLPQLMLGRIMSNDEDGSLRGTLTLASDHDLDHAVAFLTRVADLVEDPLRLLA